MAQEEGLGIVPDITCQEVTQWASAYLDDHVGDERKRQIVLHLAICAGCETYVEQIATVRDMIRLLPQIEDVSADIVRLRQAFVERLCRPRS
jgi:predicted anti-sigma-YlaC factor YlaD